MKRSSAAAIAVAVLAAAGVAVFLAAGGCERREAGRDRLERRGLTLKVPASLDAADLQTPLESTLGSILTRAESWGLLTAVRRLLARTERGERIQRSATTNEVQHGELYDAIQDCARILHVDAPQVFVKADPQASAYVTGVGQPVMVLHEKLVRDLTLDELRFVIGHELTHIKCRHVFLRMLVDSLGRALQRGLDTTPLPPAVLRFAQSGLALLVLKWYRETEHTADRGGLLCVQDLELARRALAKVAGGLDPARLDQDSADFERQFEALTRTPTDRTIVGVLELFQTHGFGANRIRKLTQWAGTERYRQILAR